MGVRFFSPDTILHLSVVDKICNSKRDNLHASNYFTEWILSDFYSMNILFYHNLMNCTLSHTYTIILITWVFLGDAWNQSHGFIFISLIQKSWGPVQYVFIKICFGYILRVLLYRCEWLNASVCVCVWQLTSIWLRTNLVAIIFQNIWCHNHTFSILWFVIHSQSYNITPQTYICTDQIFMSTDVFKGN